LLHFVVSFRLCASLSLQLQVLLLLLSLVLGVDLVVVVFVVAAQLFPIGIFIFFSLLDNLGLFSKFSLLFWEINVVDRSPEVWLLLNLTPATGWCKAVPILRFEAPQNCFLRARHSHRSVNSLFAAVTRFLVHFQLHRGQPTFNLLAIQCQVFQYGLIRLSGVENLHGWHDKRVTLIKRLTALLYN